MTNDGKEPYAGLALGTDGNFYGTTFAGGSASLGTVFRISPTGVVTIIHSFGDGSVANDGAEPLAGLILGPDGNFYGTTHGGGTPVTYGESTQYYGTVFRITPSGAETVLYSFDGNNVAHDGEYPDAALAFGPDGGLYGTTPFGGSANAGTVFRISPTGSYAVIHTFDDGSVADDGEYPKAGLFLGPDGNFYATTEQGGSGYSGTVFKITPTGSETVLHAFGDGSVTNDGENPVSCLVLGVDGNLYGTTEDGGSADKGTVYRISLSGSLMVLHSFGDGSVLGDGWYPYAGLALGPDGNFYGTTQTSLPEDGGTVFQISPSGTETVLHNFNGETPSDGLAPEAALVVGDDATFYGTTTGQNNNQDDGTVFHLGVGYSGIATITSASPASGPFGQVVDLMAAVTTKIGGYPVGDQMVSFAVDGTQVGSAVTNPSGVAILPYTVTSGSGKWALYYTTALVGNSTFASSASTATFTVTAIPTVSALSTMPTSGFAGQVVTIAASLSSAAGSYMLPNRGLNFYADGVRIAVVNTNAAGVASTTYTIPVGDATGPHAVKVYFSGDSHYASSMNSSTLTVRQPPTTITTTHKRAPLVGASVQEEHL